MTWKKYIEHISVSQIRTHDRNPRRWALEKLVKLPTMDSPYTKMGSEIHDALEFWLNQRLPNAKSARLAIEEGSSIVHVCVKDFFDNVDIPINHYKYQPELAITLSIADDIPPFRGYIDVYIHNYFKGCPLIMDHKTSRTRRYFLKTHQLKHDVQMLVYAKYALDKTQAAGVFIQHNQIAYSLKRTKTTIRRTFVTAERINQAMDRLADEVREGILKTIAEYDAGRTPGTSKCKQCACAFGPKSCEFEPICRGKADVHQYRRAYKNLTENGDTWYIKDMLDKLDNVPAFEPIDLVGDLVGDLSGDHEGATMLKLTELMAKARNKFGHITNVWDRREAMTTAVLNTIKEKDPDVVVLPSHFIGGTFDPDYLPIITGLVELDFYVAVELTPSQK